jgi:hypothetical protein
MIACGGSGAPLITEWTGTIECNRTTNTGLSWQLTYFDTMTNCQALAFANKRIGYAFTELHSVPGVYPHEVNLKTTDGGGTWFPIPAHIPAGSFGVSGAYFQNSNVGFLSGHGIAKTTDAGITWNVVFGGSTFLGGMSWPDSVHGWAYSGNGTIYRTTNGGGLPIVLASFTARHLGGTRVRLDWRTLSETNNYGFFVQRRRASDTSFTEISSLIPGYGTTNEPHDYTWTDSNASIARWYYRLKQVDLGGPVHYTEPVIVDVTTGAAQHKAPFEFRLEQNYPNPFNPSTRIAYSVQGSGFTSLKVFDILGREVATLVNELKQAGTYEVNFDASKLSSGVYMYRLQSAGLSVTRKLLLTR